MLLLAHGDGAVDLVGAAAAAHAAAAAANGKRKTLMIERDGSRGLLMGMMTVLVDVVIYNSRIQQETP